MEPRVATGLQKSLPVVSLSFLYQSEFSSVILSEAKNLKTYDI